jgi:hypothetical protein
MTIALGATLSACGGGSSSGQSAGTPATPASGAPASGAPAPAASPSAAALPVACKILTKSMAASAVGSPAKKTLDATPNTFETHCVYSGSKGFVGLLAGTWSIVSDSAGPTAKPVSGLGDQAEVGAAGLYVRKGTQGLNVMVGITGSFSGSAANSIEAEQLKLEKQLAKKILPGL